MLANRLVIVTGANRGLGYALVDRLLQHKDKPRIILTSRNPALGEEACQQLLEKHQASKDRLIYQELDIDSSQSISEFTYWLFNNHKSFDILINNAALGNVRDIMMNKGYVMPPDEVSQTIQTNFYSTVDLTENLLPFLSETGKIIMQSSVVAKFSAQGKPIKEFLSNPNVTKENLFDKMKEFEEKAVKNEHTAMGFSKSIYSVTKAFLNAYTTHILKPQLKEGQTCFTVYPGWCKTNLGTEKAPMSAEQGTLSAMTALELDKKSSQNNNGGFFDEKGKLISY